MRVVILVACLILTSCETTRTNNSKPATRPTYCYPADRC